MGARVWPLKATRCYVYDSYYRTGYARTSTNPRGYHWAWDVSRRKNSSGDWVSLNGVGVKASHAGRVVKEGWNDYWGWYIRIKSEHGTQWLYSHLKYRAKLRVGNWASAGELLGYVGSSGNATAAHLHLEMWKGDSRDPRFNPYKYMKDMTQRA